MSELRSAGNNMNNEFGNSVNWMSKLKMAAKAFIAVKVVGWLKDVHNQAYETRKEFRQIRGSPSKYFPVAEEGQ